MRTMTSALVLVTAGILLSPSIARAGRNAAQKLKGSFVTARRPCTDPNATVSPSFPVTGAKACTPTQHSDPQCGFNARGSGRFSLAVSKRGISVSVKLTGLDPGCEGEQLSLVVDARATTGDCGSGGARCTVEDSESRFLFPARPCIVSGGECRLGGALPADDLPNSSIEIMLLGIGVFRGSVHTFQAGFLVPPGTRSS